MTLSRRQFVSGSVLLGAGLAAGPALSASLFGAPIVQSRLPLLPLLIRTGLPLDQDLANGAAAAMRALGAPALGELLLPTRLDGGLRALTARLEPHQGQRMIGIMSDASFLMLQEAVRDMSGALLWEGTHAADLQMPGAVLGEKLAQVGAGMDEACDALVHQCKVARTTRAQGAAFVSFVIEI